MPYVVKKQGDKYHLYKKGSDGKPEGDSLGAHESRASALDQMKAIYANENKKELIAAGAKYWDNDYPSDMGYGSRLSFLAQDDPRVNYDPLGGNKTYACANCEFFNARNSSCQLVTGDIVATGYCDLWTRELSKDEIQAQTAIPVLMLNKNIKDRVLDGLKEFFGGKPDETTKFVDTDSGFKTFGPDNRYWAAFYSNNAKDLDGEWFPQAATDNYIARLDNKSVPMPYLWYWHEPDLQSGRAFWVDRVGHITIAVGEFDNTPAGQSMKEFFATTDIEHKLSHGFLYPRALHIDGAYWDYTTFEISPLVAGKEANPYTAFGSIEEISKMAVTAEKRKLLENALGKERADALLGSAEAKSKQLDAMGLEFKGATDNPMEARFKAIESKQDLILEAVADLVATKKKTGKEGSAEEEATESDAEAEEEGDKPKKKKAATPATVVGDKALEYIAQSVGKLADAVVAQGKQIKAIQDEFANPVSATRSPHTIVPPDNPAVAALSAKMAGIATDANPNAIPGVADQQSPEQMFNTVFGPLFNGNGKHA